MQAPLEPMDECPVCGSTDMEVEGDGVWEVIDTCNECGWERAQDRLPIDMQDYLDNYRR